MLKVKKEVKKLINAICPIAIVKGEEEKKIKEKLARAKELELLEKETFDKIEDFYELMFEQNLYNKFRKTYSVTVTEKTKYGYKAIVKQPNSLPLSKLQSIVGEVQECLKCIWVMQLEKFKDYAEVMLVLKDIDPNLEYTPPKLKPFEFYMGVNFALETNIVNVHKHNMILFSGATGTGKTTFVQMVLLSWILVCSHSEVEIYLADISKDEFSHFRNAIHIKRYASELEELFDMMQELREKIKERKAIIKKFRAMGKATNIKEYNEIREKQKMPLMPIVYVVIDELSELMADAADTEEEEQMKKYCMFTLKKLARMGRNLGLFTYVGTQKTSNNEMPAFLKNQSAVRYMFRANDAPTSEVLLGHRAAVGLTDRYAVWSVNGGERYDYLFSPKITTERITKLLRPYNVDKTKVIPHTPEEAKPVPDKSRGNDKEKRNTKTNDKPKKFKPLPSVEEVTEPKIDTTKIVEADPPRTTTGILLKRGDDVIDR